MERTIVRRISAAVIALLVAFSMLYISVGEVNAADTWEILGENVYYSGMSGYNVNVSSWNDQTQEYKDGVVKSVKSSNPKVVKINKSTWDGVAYYSMDFKKVGKAKITVKFKKPDGSTGTLSKTLKVKKYPNQIKSLKVNGKKVKTSKGSKRYEYYITGYKKTKANVKVALKKGWKVSAVYVHAYSSKKDKTKDIKVKKSAVKKGSAIKFPKGYDYLNINIEMKKGNSYITYYVGMTKNKY